MEGSKVPQLEAVVWDPDEPEPGSVTTLSALAARRWATTVSRRVPDRAVTVADEVMSGAPVPASAMLVVSFEAMDEEPRSVSASAGLTRWAMP